VTNDWGSGYTAAIRIKNNRTTAINGWSVNWSYSDASRISNSWNATLAGSNPYSATGLSWNSSIQPGQTVEFGFQGTKNNGPASVPVISGAVCN
jgi:cellulase/cellobiase CelA1